MSTTPRISVVTSSYNQGAFIGRTVDSVLAQNYSDLEHIVVDGMSTDETPRVLAGYRHLRVIREPDRGQADAINKGFRAATGDILCFLNSDDTLEPGALARVARELDPARDRQVVVGRCRYIDEQDQPTGVEHPCVYVGHRRLLEIWKGHAIPQPATFWTRAVWERCGPLDVNEHLVLDYDFFCRASEHYPFHVIDQVLANYRLHAQSKTCSAVGDRVLEAGVRASRRYWAALPFRERVRLLCSYAAFRLSRRQRALGQLRRAWRSRQRQNSLAAALRLAWCAAFAPDVLLDVALLPVLLERLPERFGLNWLARLCAAGTDPAPTQGWREWKTLHPDGWAGPTCVLALHVKPGDRCVELTGCVEYGHHPEALRVELRLDGRTLGQQDVGRRRNFRVTAPLGDVAPGEHRLEVLSNTSLVLHDFVGNMDLRPVTFKLRQLKAAG
jgi:glycosyltransferase involved in cell wall biosynthesis